MENGDIKFLHLDCSHVSFTTPLQSLPVSYSTQTRIPRQPSSLLVYFGDASVHPQALQGGS